MNTPYPTDYIPFLVPAWRAESLMHHETAITDIAASLAASGQKDIIIHLEACRHCRELILCHESDSPADELPRLSAEQLLCFHLDWLDNRLNTPPSRPHSSPSSETPSLS